MQNQDHQTITRPKEIPLLSLRDRLIVYGGVLLIIAIASFCETFLVSIIFFTAPGFNDFLSWFNGDFELNDL